MSETIKLFGKMIQLSSNTDEDTVIASRTETSAALSAAIVDIHCDSSSSDQNFLCSKQGQNRGNEDTSTDAAMETKQEGEQSSTSVLEESKTPTSPSINSENPETNIKDKVSSSQDLAKKDKEQDSDEASSNSESPDQNPLKKPDKILPCARCNSMDTKFCYYNNYNVNQPRHFCKNCQRYWTAGGSMRNVPVGAGRRKSKNSTASQHRHLIIPGASDGLIHHVMRPDGTVLAFGFDSPLSDQSKSSMLRLGEGPQNVFTNGCFRSENGKKCSITMSNSNSISIEKGEKCNGGKESSEVVPSFPFSWNPIPWQSGYPVSFYSTSTPQWGENLAGPCNMNWFPTPSMNSDQSSTNSSPISSILGKHPREGTKLMPCNTNNKESPKEKELEDSRVGIPKTMRVDDPFEAAKSSIWTSIGIKNSHVGSSNGRLAFFGGLQPVKGVNYVRRNINQNVEASSMVLQANPAAFSRSLAFHEIAQ